MKLGFLTVFITILTPIAAACGLQAATPSTPTTEASEIVEATTQNTLQLAQNCIYPAGWYAYTVQAEETVTIIAARHGLSPEVLLQENCLSSPSQVFPGALLYVPPVQPAPSGTRLPLGISQLSVDTGTITPGSVITVTWQTTGNAISVQLGWRYENQFVATLSELQPAGTAVLNVPDDGRQSVPLLLRVSDGAEVRWGQVDLVVSCAEGWFFTPAPEGCPSAPLLTTFHEQRFENGTIVYIPALGRHYVMVVGQQAVVLNDDYVPGMVMASIAVPQGFFPTTGPIGYIWRSEGVGSVLGQAITQEIIYPGLMQRTVRASTGEMIYFSASSGHVYQTGNSMVWGVIIPS